MSTTIDVVTEVRLVNGGVIINTKKLEFDCEVREVAEPLQPQEDTLADLNTLRDHGFISQASYEGCVQHLKDREAALGMCLLP